MSEFGGFNAHRRRVLESWVVEAGSNQLTPGPATASYRPHIFERRTKALRERVFVPDGVSAMSVVLGAESDLEELRILFFLEPTYTLSSQAPDGAIFRSQDTHMKDAAYVAIAATKGYQWSDREYEISSHRYYFDEHRVGNLTTVQREVRGSGFLELGDLPKGREKRISVGVGSTELEALKRARVLRDSWPEYLQAKESRLRGLVNQAGLQADSESLRRALNFALTSLDSLFVEEPFGRAIWAGLPWFNQSWGRDTFISLRAALALGWYEETRRILRSYAAFQRASDGRIPNLISDPADTAYNSADAVWWSVKVAYEHYLYSGDRSFLQEMYAVLSRALKRTYEAYGDEDGLLITGSKETWMDTSADPREGKPVEVQALWIDALSIGARTATLLGREEDGRFYEEVLQRATSTFDGAYWNPHEAYLVDYINLEGENSPRLRPNAILAYSALRQAMNAGKVSTEVFREDRLRSIAGSALERDLLTAWGVRSLSADGDIYLPKDTWTWDSPAYHNGDVWPWLSGAAMEMLADTHHFEETEMLLRAFERDFLGAGNVGSGTEILDGEAPTPRGAWTQAWSAAEFLRAFHQVVLGIRPSESGLLVSPVPLPSSGDIGASVTFQGTAGHVDYSSEEDAQRVHFQSGRGIPLQVRMVVPSGARGYKMHVREGGETAVVEGDRDADVVILNFTDAVDVEVALEPL